MFEMFGLGGVPTDWVIDVWNCHGVLKMRAWGVGYGSKPKLPEGLEWLNVGYFDVPIKTQERQFWDDRLKRKIDGLLSRILEENGGAINWSGIYPVYLHQLEQIFTTVAKYHRKTHKEISLKSLF
ncbi:hypothetical protein DRO69_02530 [Candidatus Bathyarchaeota archaeon]|nr:MAG: hypothetical protein DRO69_02530 [Candidatus Bathyarchaeota archaeon]